MKPREFHLRLELSDQLNIVRISRWIRTYGRKVRLVPRFERRIRNRAADSGRRRRMFKRTA